VLRRKTATDESVERRPGLTSALRHRDFALLWFGQSVSVTGDGIFTVALAIEVLRVDSHPLALAFVMAARLIPTVLLLLLGGAVVDRVPRRLAMLASDVVRGAVVTTFAILIAEGSLGLGGLEGLAVVFGTADAFFSPASTAIVPELLPEDVLVGASAMSSISQVFAQQLIGPALGGVIVAAAGTGWSFALDGASFAVSAACLVAMASRPRPAPSGRSMLADVREGLAYCRSQPWLWASIAGAGLANFAIFSPLGVLIPLLVRRVLHSGPTALGLTLAAGGVGGLVAVITAGRRGLPRRPIATIWTGWASAGAIAACVGLAPGVGLTAVLYGAEFGLMMYGNAIWFPLMQRLVPGRLLGRASSVDWLVSLGLTPLGIIASGAVSAAIGVRTTILIGGALATASALVLLIPGVRDPDHESSRPNAAGDEA
jgi:MFS family permease